MIAVRVRDDDRRKRMQAHASQLAVDACLGWAGVDQHRPCPRSSSMAVALPDVEERDAQARAAETTSEVGGAPTSRAM